MLRVSFTAFICVIALASCQPAEKTPPPRPPAVLDITMLGIWPERYQAYEISNALEEAGIVTTMSGNRPTILNVETQKLGQAEAMVAANPKWQQSRIR